MADQNFNKNQLSRRKDAERRYLPRWEVDNRIEYQLEHDPAIYEARSKDLNCSGACLVTPVVFKPDTKIKLKVFLSKSTSVEIAGKILWNKTSEEGNLVGIDFCDVPQQVHDILLNYAFDIKREDLIRHWFKGWNANG